MTMTVHDIDEQVGELVDDIVHALTDPPQRRYTAAVPIIRRPSRRHDAIAEWLADTADDHLHEPPKDDPTHVQVVKATNHHDAVTRNVLNDAAHEGGARLQAEISVEPEPDPEAKPGFLQTAEDKVTLRRRGKRRKAA